MNAGRGFILFPWISVASMQIRNGRLCIFRSIRSGERFTGLLNFRFHPDSAEVEHYAVKLPFEQALS